MFVTEPNPQLQSQNNRDDPHSNLTNWIMLDKNSFTFNVKFQRLEKDIIHVNPDAGLSQYFSI